MRNRKKFNEVKYRVLIIYPDNTEELVKEFKYKKVAERFINTHTIDLGVFSIEEVPTNVL